MSEQDDSGDGSIFSQFANAMIERSLPAIRQWLRQRLGPRASLGDVSVDGVRIVVKDARVPLGAAVLLVVDEATLVARPEGFATGRAAASLSRLRGVVRFERGALTTLEAPVEIEGRPGAGDGWVDGTLRLAGATWAATRGVGDALPLEGTAELKLGAEAWSVRDATLTSGGSQVRGWASGTLGGEVLRSGELELDRGRLGHTLDVIEAFTGRAVSLPVPLPLDALVDARAALGGGRVNATIELATERSEARVAFDHRAGVIKDATIEGRAHPEELLPEAWRGAVAMDACGPVAFEGRLEGPLRALEGTLTLTAEAFALTGQREPSAARALIALRGDAGVDFDLTLEGAGRAFGQVTIAESLAGGAQLTLEPGAWQIAGRTIGGEAARVDLALSGPRSSPLLEARLEGPRLELSHLDRAPLVLRRARGRLALEGGRVARVDLSARVGPGRARARREGETWRLQLDRLGRSDLVALHDLLFARRWLGTSREHARFVVPDGTEGWADLEVRDHKLRGHELRGPRVEGTVHLEAPRSRVSLAPLALDLSTGATDGTVARAIVSGDDAAAIGLFDGSPIAPVGPGRAEIGATLTGAGRGMRLFVAARARELGVGPVGASAPQAVVEDAVARFVLGADGLEVQELSGVVFGGYLEASGRLGGGGLTLERARWAAAGEELRRRVLPDPSVDALRELSVELEVSGTERDLRARLAIDTDRSALQLRVQMEALRFLEEVSELEGQLDPRDLGGLLGPVRLRADEPLEVAGRLSGSWDRPEAHLLLNGDAGQLALLVTEGDDKAAALPFEGLTLDALLTREQSSVRLALEGLSGGAAELEAAVLTARPLLGSMATLSVRDVDLGPAKQEIEGRLSGHAATWKLGGHTGARASATLEEPRYPILYRVASVFSRYGLKTPALEGVGPATATVTLDRGDVRVTELGAAIEGLSVRGGAHRSEGGYWDAELRVEAKEAWLRTSHLLSAPASWLGDLVLPVHVEGPDRAVRARADVLATLDRAIAKTRFGRGVQRAIDKVLEQLFSRPPPPEPAADHHAPSDVTTADALLDRVAAGDRDADRALGALLERGGSPRELALALTRRRAGDP